MAHLLFQVIANINRKKPLLIKCERSYVVTYIQIKNRVPGQTVHIRSSGNMFTMGHEQLGTCTSGCGTTGFNTTTVDPAQQPILESNYFRMHCIKSELFLAK
jgi:hypothetical protein